MSYQSACDLRRTGFPAAIEQVFQPQQYLCSVNALDALAFDVADRFALEGKTSRTSIDKQLGYGID